MLRQLLISLLTGIAIMNAVFADTSYKEPLFSLEFNIYGTGAEIRLNDTPVYYHDTQGQTSSQKPIPESIINGVNILTVKSFPLKDDNNQYLNGAYIEAIISVREKNAPVNVNKAILQLKLNPTNPDNTLLEGTIPAAGDKDATILNHDSNQIIAERHTSIKSPFPRWAWQDGQNIVDSTQNYNSLLKKYKEIWILLNNGDKDETKKIYDTAAEEFAIAYHYNDKEQGHRIMNTGGLINDEDWKLGSIDKFLEKFNYHLDIHSNGKIAQILDQKRRSPIVYLGRKAKIINIQKFGFYKNSSGEWIMIR